MTDTAIHRPESPSRLIPPPPTYVGDGLAVRLCFAGRPLAPTRVACPSIHVAWDGRFPLRVDDRALRLDDDAFVVLNGHRQLAAAGPCDPEAKLLSVYFAPERVLQAAASRASPTIGLEATPATLEFFEHLREHDRPLASVMRYLAHHLRAGVDDPEWYEEQVQFLLRRLLENEAAVRLSLECMTRITPSRRREAFARLARVTDLIHSAYERPLGVEDFARATEWSPLHTLRTFKSVHGVDPLEYLERRRARAAARMLESTGLSESQVAKHVGFVERSALARRLRAHALATSQTDRASIGQAMHSAGAY